MQIDEYQQNSKPPTDFQPDGTIGALRPFDGDGDRIALCNLGEYEFLVVSARGYCP